MSQIVVLGSNFAGVTASIQAARKLGKIDPSHKVTVISPKDKFLYVPSMIWVSFGSRKVKDISFDVVPVLKKKGVGFIHDEAVGIDPENNVVKTTKNGDISYDYLIVAAGCGLNFDTIPGFNKGYTECCVTPAQGERAYEAFNKLVKDPGPVVVGATQGASCMGAAYEYLFNLEKQLRKHKVRDKVDLTWITPERHLGDFGIGGVAGGEAMLKMFMKMFNIRWFVNCVIREIESDKITLEDGTVLPYKMAFLMPPFKGPKPLLNTPQLTDDKGFLLCNDGYQHEKYKNVYGAGMAISVKAPFTPIAAPYGVPKTGYPTDMQGKIAAENVSRAVRGIREQHTRPFAKIPGICIMDAGNKEVFIFTSTLYKPRVFEIMIPNVFYNIGKRLLEKYMLWKNRHGLVFLP